MKEKKININKIKSWFFEKINKIDKPLARLIKKKRRIKSTKLKIKKKRLQQTMQKYKGLQETIMNNYIAIKWITWEKWTDSLKSSIFQDNQEEIEIMNKPITSIEIETVI